MKNDHKTNDLSQLKRELQADLAAIERVLEIEARRNGNAKPSTGALSTPKTRGGRQLNDAPGENGQFLENTQVRSFIFDFGSNFGTGEIESGLAKKFPDKHVRRGQVASVIHQLKKSQKLKEVSERVGRNGAQYTVK